MDFRNASRKDVGNYGESAAALYLRRQGFRVVARNVARKTGELDVVAERSGTLHIVEVKTLLCDEFPNPSVVRDEYDPSVNLHPAKIRRVARTAQWYVAEREWEGEWQVDGALVWVRRRDGKVLVSYYEQIF